MLLMVKGISDINLFRVITWSTSDRRNTVVPTYRLAPVYLCSLSCVSWCTFRLCICGHEGADIFFSCMWLGNSQSAYTNQEFGSTGKFSCIGKMAILRCFLVVIQNKFICLVNGKLSWNTESAFDLDNCLNIISVSPVPWSIGQKENWSLCINLRQIVLLRSSASQNKTKTKSQQQKKPTENHQRAALGHYASLQDFWAIGNLILFMKGKMKSLDVVSLFLLKYRVG